MTEQNYTSLELSQKLQEAGFDGESEMWWVRKRDNSEGIAKKIEDVKYKFILERWGEVSDICNFPAYDIINDLCVRYAKEVWGENRANCSGCGARNAQDCDCFAGIYETPPLIPAVIWCSRQVLSLLQQGKKAEAEEYLWERCLLNPKNK